MARPEKGRRGGGGGVGEWMGFRNTDACWCGVSDRGSRTHHHCCLRHTHTHTHTHARTRAHIGPVYAWAGQGKPSPSAGLPWACLSIKWAGKPTLGRSSVVCTWLAPEVACTFSPRVCLVKKMSKQDTWTTVNPAQHTPKQAPGLGHGWAWAQNKHWPNTRVRESRGSRRLVETCQEKHMCSWSSSGSTTASTEVTFLEGLTVSGCEGLEVLVHRQAGSHSARGHLPKLVSTRSNSVGV